MAVFDLLIGARSARRRALAACALLVAGAVPPAALAQASSYAQGEMLWQTTCGNGACHSLSSRQTIFAALSQSQARARLDNAINTVMSAFSGLTGAERDSLVIFIGNFIPVASVAPGLTLNFTSTAVGTPSAATTITVTNTGRIAMNVGANIAKSGTHPGDFAVSGVGNGCAAQTVQVSSSCQLSVVFTPSATGARAATVTLTHNGDPSTTVIQLSGTTGGGGGGSPPAGAGGDGGGGAFGALGLLLLLVPAALRRRKAG